MWKSRLVLAHLVATALAGATASAQTLPRPPAPSVVLAGAEKVIFDPAKDACDGYDVPDMPARAFRGADGRIRLLAMHFENRAMIGASFDTLKLDCRVIYRTGNHPDPARYDGLSWITSVWTADGRTINGLTHHEYHADQHKGRCISKEVLPCWFNSVFHVRSTDGGLTFTRPDRALVASAPFRQDVEQGRHRGFFNPSNIVTDGVWHYMMTATTGWAQQPYGACLFRTDNIADPARWRAYDGLDFQTAFRDPYREKTDPALTCQPLAPFPAPVGSISRHRGSGQWVAVFQAAAGGRFPVSGFYAAASRDLKFWSEAKLILATKTNYDEPCGAGVVHSYPALIDPAATTRSFEDVGDSADLYFTRMRIDGCTHTSDRTLIRVPVSIGIDPAPAR